MNLNTRHILYLLLSTATALLLWLSFPPVDFGAAAWIALAPWLVLVGMAKPKHAAIWSMVAGMAFFLPALHWLRFVTWAGWISLAFYCALYWPLAALLLGWMRRRGLPLPLTAPVALVTFEFIRSALFTGFPFLFLGHTQYQYIPVIQIADLTGAYGISFLVAFVNAVLAEWALGRFRVRKTTLAYATAALIILGATVFYGVQRRAALRPAPGPRVLMVQANVPQDLKHSPSLADGVNLLKTHVRLSQDASGTPDLVVWPETMFPAPINMVEDHAFILRLRLHQKDSYREYGEHLTQCRQVLREYILSQKVWLLTGAETQMANAQRFNSAYLIGPDGKASLTRYDKMHLVVFGEYVPVELLRFMRPAVMGDDLSPGQLRSRFEFPAADGRTYRFGVTICYEDSVANLFRKSVRDGVDFMVNITNDGWFRDSSELDQHLAVCAFRAVENRIGIARNANTGISAFIAPDGRITRRIVDENGRWRGIQGSLEDEVPISNLKATYSRIGDLFAWLCVAATAGLSLAALFRRPAAAPTTTSA